MSVLSQATPSQHVETMIAQVTASFTAQIKREKRISRRRLNIEEAAYQRLVTESKQCGATIEKRRARLLPLARRGLAHIMTFSSQASMIEMLEVSEAADPTKVFHLYEASRLSGEAWDRRKSSWINDDGTAQGCHAERIARIKCTQNAISLFAGTNFGADTNWWFELKYTATPSEREALLERLIGSVLGGTRGRHALKSNQFTDEWDPEELLAYVLAECAQQKNLKYYLEIAFKNFRSK